MNFHCSWCRSAKHLESHKLAISYRFCFTELGAHDLNSLYNWFISPWPKETQPKNKWGEQCGAACLWSTTESLCKLFSSILTSGIIFHYKAIECKWSFPFRPAFWKKRWAANCGHVSRNLNIASKWPSLSPEQWLPPKLDGGGIGSVYSCLVCLLRSVYIWWLSLDSWCFFGWFLFLSFFSWALRGWRGNLSKAVDMTVKHAWIIPHKKVGKCCKVLETRKLSLYMNIIYGGSGNFISCQNYLLFTNASVAPAKPSKKTKRPCLFGEIHLSTKACQGVCAAQPAKATLSEGFHSTLGRTLRKNCCPPWPKDWCEIAIDLVWSLWGPFLRDQKNTNLFLNGTAGSWSF